LTLDDGETGTRKRGDPPEGHSVKVLPGSTNGARTGGLPRNLGDLAASTKLWNREA
jgi:hypothetical protein